MTTECQYYTKLESNQVQCHLCPRNCIVEVGKFGDCFARRNRSGTLTSEVYGRLAALNSDPIEKKPLYHFYPGHEILSVGTTGCNLHCVFCQNHTLSQCQTRRPAMVKNLTPDELVDLALKTPNNLGIAFTYNEPTINFEYVLETSMLAQNNGLKTVLVSNGYINPDPMSHLINCIDAFNIDLKAFDNKFYQRMSKGTLVPVLKSIEQIAKSGKHLEITNLVIPTFNDNEEMFDRMCQWIAKTCGTQTVLHLSRYFPRYELDQYPTPPETLFILYDIAKAYLPNTYIGNMATELHSSTRCPQCGKTVIDRTYFNTSLKGLKSDGTCKKCGFKIIEHI